MIKQWQANVNAVLKLMYPDASILWDEDTGKPTLVVPDEIVHLKSEIIRVLGNLPADITREGDAYYTLTFDVTKEIHK